MRLLAMALLMLALSGCGSASEAARQPASGQGTAATTPAAPRGTAAASRGAAVSPAAASDRKRPAAGH